MSNSRTLRFVVEATFDDGHRSDASFDVVCAEGEAPEIPDVSTVRIALGGTVTDDDARHRLVDALRSRIDEALGQALPESDLDESIAHVAAALVGSSTSANPSKPQQRKFEAFAKHPQRDLALRVLRSYLEAIDALTPETMGSNWGVTVALDQTNLLRVNVGLVVVLGVESVGTAHLSLRGDPTGLAPPAGLAPMKGFDKGPPNFAYGGPAKAVIESLKEVRIRAAASARVDDVWRRLFQRNYHNPLIESLM